MQDLRQLTEAAIKNNPSIATSPTTTAPREQLISVLITRRHTRSMSQESQQVLRVHKESAPKVQHQTAPIVTRVEQKSAPITNQASRGGRKRKQRHTVVNITVNAVAPEWNIQSTAAPPESTTRASMKSSTKSAWSCNLQCKREAKRALGTLQQLNQDRAKEKYWDGRRKSPFWRMKFTKRWQ